MRSMHSVLKHGGLFWDQAVTTPAACEKRFKRVQQAVAESGDDAWLVYGDVQRHGNIAFVSNFLPRVRSALVFVPRKGAPVLLANIGLRDVPAAKTMTWVDDIRPFGRLPKDLAALIDQQGLKAARLGTCGFDISLPVSEWEAIEKALPQVRWASRDDHIARLRATKDAADIAALRRASDIATTALDIAPDVLRPDANLRQAIAAIDLAARRQGAEDTSYMIGISGGSLRPVTDRKLLSGEVLTLYMTVQSQRYWAEAARSFVLGAADGQLRTLFARGQDVMAAMAAETHASATAADLARAAKATLGDEALLTIALSYGLGNGIGLDCEEGPLVSEADGSFLGANSVLATRFLVQQNGMGIGLSQTLVTRAKDCESITTPAALVELAP